MTTFQKIRDKAQKTIEAIDAYEAAWEGKLGDQIVDNHRSNAATHSAELAQLIITAAKSTEVLTEN